MNRFLVDLCFWRSRSFQGSRWKWSTPTHCLPACHIFTFTRIYVHFWPRKIPVNRASENSVSTGTGRNYFVFVTPGQRWRVVNCT